MQAKRFFFEKKKQKTFIHCRRHGVRTENSVPSETGKSFLVLFCKKERIALLRFQWVDLPGQRPFFKKEQSSKTLLFEKTAKTFMRFIVAGWRAHGSERRLAIPRYPPSIPASWAPPPPSRSTPGFSR